MPCGTFVVRKMTEAQADNAVKTYNVAIPGVAPPTSVTKEKDDKNPGMFKVTAVYPPCPPGVNDADVEHSPTGKPAVAITPPPSGPGTAPATNGAPPTAITPSGAGGGLQPPGTSETWTKPAVEFIHTDNCSSRNGARIGRIILHYTTSDNVGGTIAWFKDPISQVSAHYVIARDGKIYQMVRDGDKAWHAKGANTDSIGIEHSAAAGEQMTSPQEQSSIALIKWLLSEYKLRATAIHGHRFTPENAGSTDCPGELFGAATESAITQWVAKHFAGF